MSQKVREAISDCQVIVAYKTYIRLLGNFIDGKEVVASCMTQEIKRAEQAIEKALEGKSVCLVSSGDPGIYGMASVALELLKNEDAKRINIEIIPGIMAATACASLLGAPLAHDFCVISLSDLLTDWEKIQDRIRTAAKADFVLVLYNPKSNSRVKPLKQAWKLISRYRVPKTPVGIVRNAYRDKEEIKITTLKEATMSEDIDMATTIIVGNSKTYIKNGYMVTPRGYRFMSHNLTNG